MPQDDRKLRGLKTTMYV